MPLHGKPFRLAGPLAALLLASGLAGCGDRSGPAVRAQALQHQQQGQFATALILLKDAAQSSPEDAATRQLLAAVYLDTGDGITAEKEIRMALQLGGAPDAALPVLGKALVWQGRFQKALDDTMPAAAGNTAELSSVRADAYLGLGQTDAARALYEKALQARPAFPAALIGLGRLAYLAHDVDTARQYADRALAAAPRDTDALLFKGDLLRAQQRPVEALASYDQVLRLQPEHHSAHVEKAYLDIAMGSYAAAEAELEAARKISPGSVLVAYTQALLDFSQGKNSAALESMQKVLRVAPEHMPSVLLAGAINLNLGSLQQAEHHLHHFLGKNPTNLYARKMLAQTLLRSGHSSDALEVLAPALKASRQDVQLLALAGESYMQVRNFTKAAEFFEKASALDPKAAKLLTSLAMSKLGKGEQAQAVSDLRLASRLDTNSPQAGIALVRTELGLGHIDNAYAAVLALQKTQANNAAVEDLKGQVHLGRRDAASARASFRQALVLQPSYFPAAEHLAQLDLGDQNSDGARETLLRFLAVNKGSIEAMSALASQAVSERKMADATRWLEKASAVDPNAIGPAVNLLAQYLLVGQHPQALGLARKLQVSHPDNPDLLDLLGKSQLASGERDNALETYKRLAVALPRSPHAQMQVAALELLFNNTAAAENALKTALAMRPDFPAAQLALADLYARGTQHWRALIIAESLQKNYPRAPAGFQLEGDVLMAQNKAALAVPAFERALALSATSELAIKTINALRAAGRPEEGAARLAQWLGQHRDDLRMRLYKAETLLADRQYKAAAGQLEAILVRAPDHAAALNNLALAYQQMNDGRALPTAQAAYRLAAGQPAIGDTLGWLLVEQGAAAQGLTILLQASAQAPAARDIRYHLAVARLKTGDKAAARKLLADLLAGDMRFAQAEAARALFKQLP